jgi:acetyl-CoA acyltransferase
VNPVFLVDYVRTPIGRYGGALSGVRTDDLAALPLAALRERHPSVEWEQIDDVVLGCANQAGEDNRNVARMAALLAGLPEEVPGSTVNRLCGSGMDAVWTAARTVTSGEAQLVIAGGVESMSRAPFVVAKNERAFGRSAQIFDTTIGWRFVNPAMEERCGVDPLGVTAEIVAEEQGISRADQDAFALRSQQRAEAGRKAGNLAEEIVPVAVAKQTPVSRDEHPRADVTLEGLAKLRPVFRKEGTVTAGNSSGINDGSAALLVASEAACRRHGVEPIARVVGTAAAGVAPRTMGMGPVPATKKLLSRHGIGIEELDVIELNEAFASQALACLRLLGVADDDPRVNANGGAIALGHPLGMSGARLVGTAARELRRRGGRRALATMCIGVGQGISMLLEKP